MTDTSTADELPPQTNGVASDYSGLDEEERARMRPADIDADVREMERRKRVELIMNSKLFREELERIIETQLKDGTGASGLLQQISDMVGVNKQAGNVFKSSSCVIPINDIRGIESMGYAKGEKILRCKLAAVFRLIDLYGWTQGANTLITARLNQEQEQFLVNPYGMLFHEITASSLIKVDMQGSVIEQGTTNFSVNVTAFSLHAAVHAARPDIRCIIHVHTPSVVAVSALKQGLLPLSQESVVIGEVSTHPFLGGMLDADETDKLARNLGPVNKVLFLTNQGALCCGETIEETFFNARNTVLASESQLKLLPLGLDNLVLLNDEARKKIYDAAHKPPESTPRPDQPSILEGKVERKWRVGGIEFEALMRMMDNAGFRTGYIYRHPLVKGEPPKPRNDVEVPPAVSSLGYLLEEEELYRQGLWKKLEGGKKGHDRSRWLNSPNVYQKVEILETGTPDPKKITKWVADGSPGHSSTPVKIDTALQFVPQGTSPKEFKQRQQQIKDYRRADKISAGPQSHILEGVTWEEARKMQDAAVTQTGDQVVLMGAASKGIIQRGHQHNAMVYKSPYAKNPFDSVTDEELEDYKKVVEKKAKGEYDTDYSESDGLSSAQINKRMDSLHLRSPTSVTSETEEESRDEPQILRIETRTAPKPSQPEVVLSDVESSPVEQFLRAERTSVNSYKNIEELTFELNNSQHPKSYYRTHSHAGLPKGSYLIPNPVHYHIARQTQIANIMRPTIMTLVPHKHTRHIKLNNRSSHHVPKGSVITLSLKEARSVALDISMDTLKAFICPFANALNLVEIPILNNQGSQTSYMANFDRRQFTREQLNNVEYTPLYVNRYSNTLHTTNQSTSFERDILDELQQNLIEQFDHTSNSNYENGNAMDEIMNQIVEFTENDRVGSNESLADISPELATALPESSSSKSSNSGKTYNKEDSNLEVDEHSLNENEKFELQTALFKTNNNLLTYEILLASAALESSSSKSNSSGKTYNIEERNLEIEGYELKSLRLVSEEIECGLEESIRPSLEKKEITSDIPDIIYDNIEKGSVKTKRSELLHFNLKENEQSDSNINIQLDLIKDDLTNKISPKMVAEILENIISSKENEDMQQELGETAPILLNEDENSFAIHNNSLATNENDSLDEKTLEYSENRDSIGHSIIEVADKFSSEFLKVVDDYEIAMEVINEVKQILNHGQNDKESPPKSIDEGIEDPSATINESSASLMNLSPVIDSRIIKLGLVIKDYLVEQGFELKELLVFPELINDDNTVKLISKLTGLYNELYGDSLKAEDKNELRLSIANYVLNLLSLDDRFKDDSGESDNFLNISDKIFTISEYISELLDTFFEEIDNEEFSEFAKDMSDLSYAQSTPDKRLKTLEQHEIASDSGTNEIQMEARMANQNVRNLTDDTFNKDDIESVQNKKLGGEGAAAAVTEFESEGYVDGMDVTSFKKNSKGASESFWITISPLPAKPRTVPAKRVIFNVDDIPLRPPGDLNDKNCSDEVVECFSFYKGNIDDIPLKSPTNLAKEGNKYVLSPIMEEPRVNLFDSHLSSDFEIENDTPSSFDYEIVDSDDNINESNKYISSETSNAVSNSELGTSDSPTEVNIVVCNEIRFVRTSCENRKFSKKSNVVFTSDVKVKKSGVGKNTKNEENKENEPLNNSGDWMGFEGARF